MVIYLILIVMIYTFFVDSYLRSIIIFAYLSTDGDNRQPESVLFNKVSRKDILETYPSSNDVKFTQYSPDTLKREKINNNMNRNSNYIMTSNSSSFPETLSANNLASKSGGYFY